MKKIKKIVNKIVIFFENIYIFIFENFIQLNEHDIFVKIINKQLEKYKVDYKYVTLNQHKYLDDYNKQWYEYYTFDNEKDYLKWKNYSIKQIKKNRPFMSNELAAKEFTWIDLQFGLKHNFIKK